MLNWIGNLLALALVVWAVTQTPDFFPRWAFCLIAAGWLWLLLERRRSVT